jgi:hypothetical protein
MSQLEDPRDWPPLFQPKYGWLPKLPPYVESPSHPLLRLLLLKLSISCFPGLSWHFLVSAVAYGELKE